MDGRQQDRIRHGRAVAADGELCDPGAISQGILNNRPACTSALTWIFVVVTFIGPYHSTASLSIAAS